MILFDKFADLFKKEVPAHEAEAIFNRLNVDEFFSYLNNLYNPSELIEKMGGLENIDKLYKDPEIYAAIDKRMAALLDTRLVLDGGPYLQFFQDQIIPHERQLKQDFWWTVFNGYGVEQIIYKEDRSGEIEGFQKEEFWRFAPLPDLIHVKVQYTSSPNLMNKVLPYGKWVLTTNNGTYFNPTGDVMAERLIQPWLFRCTAWDLWIDFAKKFSQGFMHGKVQDQKSVKDFRAKLEKAAKGAIIVTDKNSELNLIQPSRDTSIYNTIDDKTIASIKKVILGETQTSDVSGGTYASSYIHNEVRLEKTRADINLVEDAINKVIEQIAAVNGLTGELPRATLIYDPGLNKELADRDAVLYTQGVRFNKKYYENSYGLKDDEFDITEETTPSFFNQQKKSLFLNPDDLKNYLELDKQCSHGKSSIKLAPSINRKKNKSDQEKEEVVGLLNRNGRSPIDIDDLTNAILTSKDSKDLDNKLNALFYQDSPEFIDLLTNSLYYTAAKGARLGNPKKVKPDEDE